MKNNYLGVVIGFIIAILILFIFNKTIEWIAVVAIAVGLIIGEVIRRIRSKNQSEE
jgi:hypothetical protein